MTKYKLNFTEEQKGFAEIEAECREDAEEMALDLYNSGKVIWTDSSITDILAEEIICLNGGAK